MSKQNGLSYCIFIVLAAWVATASLPIGSAFGSGLGDTLSAPTIEHVDGSRGTRGLQLKPPGSFDAMSPATGSSSSGTELLLVTRQSCRAPLQSHTPLSAIPLLEGGGEDGQWLLLAGLGWNKDSGFGAKGPVLIETDEGEEPANWYFTVEMLFVPKGRWNLRASLAIDGEELHDTVAASAPQFNPLHIGVAISFDRGNNSPLVLNLGYGRLPMEGRVLSVQPDGAPPAQVLGETRIFSACLNIQF